MPRIVISPDAVRGNSISVEDPDDLHHLVNVLRVQVGDRLECFDGAGNEYAGPILRCSRDSLVMTIRERATEMPQPLAVTLGQSLIQPERFEWVIQKTTELGVDRIIPLLTQRTTVRRLSREQAARKLTRWQRIAAEAAKQCGRSWLTRIDAPQELSEVLAASSATDIRVLMPTLVGEARSLRSELDSLKGLTRVLVLIGPEGDFTAEEVALAQRAGAHPVSLGRLTLRSETAAIAVLAVLQHLAI